MVNWFDKVEIMTEAYLPYKDPYVYFADDDAYVSLSWYCRSKKAYEREKIRLGIWGLTKKKKKLLLDELCKKFQEVVTHRNKNGIYHDQDMILNTATHYADQPLVESLKHFIADTKNSQNARDLAAHSLHNLQQLEVSNPGLLSPNFSQLSDSVLTTYVEFLQSKKLTGKTINEYLYPIGKIKEKVEKSNNIQVNLSITDHRVKQVKNESELYKPFTYDEKEQIFDYFKWKNEDYLVFLLFQYYTCIRPGESTRLFLNSFNLDDRSIYVPFYKSKNGLSQYVQILEPMHKILAKMDLSKYNQSFYLFSQTFIPGHEKKSENQLSKQFRAALKELKIEDLQMYALKHTFNRDYVINNKGNTDWEWLRRHNRHATIQQTQQYISGITAYFLDEENNIILDYT